jgi:predicted membrane channel-forming protein YqfA (hemolysin III family)
MDYAAILTLWFGGKVVYEGYFAFYCYPMLYQAWLGVALLVFLVLGYKFVLQDSYSSVCVLYVFMHVPNFFMSRVIAGMSQAGVSAAPTLAELEQGLAWCWVGSACGVLGFVVFLTRIPERWFPGYFTCWGISHQWWHIFVTLGPLCCLEAGKHFVRYTANEPCINNRMPVDFSFT